MKKIFTLLFLLIPTLAFASWNANQTSGGSYIVTDGFTTAGTVNNPTSGTIEVKEAQFGPYIRTDFTLKAASITVVDGGVTGSYGTLKIYDFPAGAITFIGTRQNYTAFAEGAALTGAVGDASFEIGIGTVAISAIADGTLGNGTQENIGQAVSITLSGGTGTGTAVDGVKTTALDGTTTALDANLNWSGTAATIDANSTITVTGTISILWTHMGDD